MKEKFIKSIENAKESEDIEEIISGLKRSFASGYITFFYENQEIEDDRELAEELINIANYDIWE